ncbi:hypothetical protein ACIRNY_02660 [Capnocytophaga canimorsus]|uniref:hypothetical protein n=1 Tax=Capnocytophaga canimorsus TaxID=28188 RepID=UPI000D6E458C|nr:hypothetical protein [Capnocytophaga canimorsus]AWL78027.1 hypothetical protein DKB58_03200 [Capnocytophaga canimorsus]MDT9499329.1 hypothetical protein [Capnocytophaga canimorsus]
METIIDKIKVWLTPIGDFLSNDLIGFFGQYPAMVGGLFIIMGVLNLIGAKQNWDWIMEGKYWIRFDKIPRHQVEREFGADYPKRLVIRYGWWFILFGIVWIIIWGVF